MSILLLAACHLFDSPQITASCETAGTCGTTGTTTATGQDADGDGWSVEAGDCDDANPDVHPGATEDCNTSYDDDCSGTDNDPDALHCLPFYNDADRDGYGGGESRCLCYPEDTWDSVSDADCDDGDPDRNPAADDPCGDGIDQDCDGADAICSLRVAVVYVVDSYVALDLASVLEDYGFDALALDATTTDDATLADQDVLLLPPEGTGADWSFPSAAVVAAGRPVLAMGLSGFDYLQQVASPLADPTAIYNDGALAVDPVDDTHPVFLTPYDLSDVDPTLKIAGGEVPGWATDVSAAVAGVDYLAVAHADPGQALLSASGREVLWSLATRAGDLTTNGEQFLVNVLTWMSTL